MFYAVCLGVFSVFSGLYYKTVVDRYDDVVTEQSAEFETWCIFNVSLIKVQFLFFYLTVHIVFQRFGFDRSQHLSPAVHALWMWTFTISLDLSHMPLSSSRLLLSLRRLQWCPLASHKRAEINLVHCGPIVTHSTEHVRHRTPPNVLSSFFIPSDGLSITRRAITDRGRIKGWI